MKMDWKLQINWFKNVQNLRECQLNRKQNSIVATNTVQNFGHSPLRWKNEKIHKYKITYFSVSDRLKAYPQCEQVYGRTFNYKSSTNEIKWLKALWLGKYSGMNRLTWFLKWSTRVLLEKVVNPHDSHSPCHVLMCTFVRCKSSPLLLLNALPQKSQSFSFLPFLRIFKNNSELNGILLRKKKKIVNTYVYVNVIF